MKPEVKLFLGNEEALTEPFHGGRPQEIPRKDPQDEEKAIGGVRNDKVGEDGMCMSAGADKAQDAEAVSDRLSAYKINQGTVIIGMDGTGAFYTTAGAGLQFRAETSHERIKKDFR